MLNQNPGLRDITHSITGGAITAQGPHPLPPPPTEPPPTNPPPPPPGYWMPYDCARAVCATFCCDIAPALIPLFGPSFPSECIPRHSPSHGRMVIDPSIIASSSRQAHMFRQMNATTPTPTPTSAPTTPLNHHHLLPSPYHHHHSADDTAPDTDVDMYSPLSAASSQRLRYLPAPLRTANTSDWTPVNNNNTAAQAQGYHPAQGQGYYSDHHHHQQIYHSRPATPGDVTPGGPSRWLSALPSRGDASGSSSSYYPLPPAAHTHAQVHPRYHAHALPPAGPLRHHHHLQHRYDDGYDAGESMNGSNSSPERERDCEEVPGVVGGREQDAAMVLLGLRTSPPAVFEEEVVGELGVGGGQGTQGGKGGVGGGRGDGRGGRGGWVGVVGGEGRMRRRLRGGGRR